MAEVSARDFRDGSWLTDACIGFAFEWLSTQCSEVFTKLVAEKKVVWLHPAVVSVISFEDDEEDLKEAVEGADMHTAQLVFIPINNFFMTSGFACKFRGSHWSLLVYDRPSDCFYHFDSGAQSNASVALKFADKIGVVMGASLMGDLKSSGSISTSEESSGVSAVGAPAASVKRKMAVTPQQSNGYDCGVYTIEVSRVLAEYFAKQGSIAGHRFSEKRPMAKKSAMSTGDESDGDSVAWISPEIISERRTEWFKLVVKSQESS